MDFITDSQYRCPICRLGSYQYRCRITMVHKRSCSKQAKSGSQSPAYCCLHSGFAFALLGSQSSSWSLSWSSSSSSSSSSESSSESSSSKASPVKNTSALGSSGMVGGSKKLKKLSAFTCLVTVRTLPLLLCFCFTCLTVIFFPGSQSMAQPTHLKISGPSKLKGSSWSGRHFMSYCLVRIVLVKNSFLAKWKWSVKPMGSFSLKVIFTSCRSSSRGSSVS